MQFAGSNGHEKAVAPLSEQSPKIDAFLKPQLRIATEYCGRLGPLDLDEYIRHDGFAALKNAGSPDEIIDAIVRSGLRGRGGAGFPTGRKWQTVRRAPGDEKYIICNGDEGDPGAFMDRMILESYPYRVLEGMAIAARAIGSRAVSSTSATNIRWRSNASAPPWDLPRARRAGRSAYWK